MDIRPATSVRNVDANESLEEVVDEAKALTWTHRCEHALLRVDNGDLILVRGGADGIEFTVEGSKVIVLVDAMPRHVTLLAWHTHPRATGPSDHDRAFLKMLGQRDSLLYEMFGDGRGTRFIAANHEVKP